MIKKLVAISSLFILAGCQNFGSSQILYKISDKDAKAIILKVNNAEQCIHPELSTMTLEEASNKIYRTYSQAEAMFWNDYMIPKKTIEVIGERNAKILFNNLASQQYASEKYNKFKNQITNIDQTECQNFKKEFKAQMINIEKYVKEEQEKQLALQKIEESQKMKQRAEEEAKKAQQQAEEEARRKQAERKRKELEAYYRTPAGQMELARQQMAKQHQEMMAQQQAIMAQQQAMYRQREAMIAAQEKAAKDRDMDNWMNSMSQGFSTPNYAPNNQLQNINRSLNQINSTLEGMTPRQPGIGPRWNNVY